MIDSLRMQLESVGQGHLLNFYPYIDGEQKIKLEEEIKSVDWKDLATIYKKYVLTRFDGSRLKPVDKIDVNLIQELPEDCKGGTTNSSKEKLDGFRDCALANIRKGKIAALLLAGGQGTRLGVDYPKGMYDVGLDTHKSLFQLQAERILELKTTPTLDRQTGKIIWYIMTSEATIECTKKFFQDNNYFGLPAADVVFFEQSTIPCFGFEGKVLLSDKFKISKSPNGNGGLYEALHKKGIINHMKNNQVEYVHVYCVDNILVRVCDPLFMGYCIDKDADAGAKVVEKVLPNESVGTICKIGDQFKVIEYSEIPNEIANKRNIETGKLCFNAGNICEHFFKVNFLESINEDRELPYHLAIKKIPHVSLETGESISPSRNNGIKLEKFIFDVFEYTQKFVVWEVRREDEFSPLKNAEGSEKDNPTTARKSLLRAYDLGLLTV